MKTRLNFSEDDLVIKAFIVHKKKNEGSSELSFFTVCFNRVFNLEMQNFGLENHCMVNA